MHQICEILNVPLSFMYDGQAKTLSGKATTLNMMHEFLATRQGLALVKAFQKIECANVRQNVLDLIVLLARSSAKPKAAPVKKTGASKKKPSAETACFSGSLALVVFMTAN
jgi:hypothetical protein